MMATLNGTCPPHKPALIDYAHHYLVEASGVLQMLLAEMETGEDRLHLERLVDGCEETIERIEEVLANREAELSEY